MITSKLYQRIAQQLAFFSSKPNDATKSESISPLQRTETVNQGENAATPKASLISHIRTSAIIETVFFLSTVVILNVLFGDGTRFLGMAFHPFWIIVLLITVQYGPAEALMAALLSSAFLLVGNLPEQSMTETMYEYILRVTTLPTLWIVAALMLGTIRARQLNERKDLQERLARAEQSSAIIVENYQAVVKSKEQLEFRLAEQRCSVLSIYEIAKSLETLDFTEAKNGIEHLVHTALNPKKFSLYLSDGKDLVLESFCGWQDSDTFKKKFSLNDPLVCRAYEGTHMLSVIKEDEEELLNGEGMLAGLLVDEASKKILGMIKIEEIGFTEMGIRTHETFRIICAWIASVYVNIDKYQTALNKKRTVLIADNEPSGKSKSDYGLAIKDNAA